jgi:hypothetical protein
MNTLERSGMALAHAGSGNGRVRDGPAVATGGGRCRCVQASILATTSTLLRRRHPC